jgi:hypothetical protein
MQFRNDYTLLWYDVDIRKEMVRESMPVVHWGNVAPVWCAGSFETPQKRKTKPRIYSRIIDGVTTVLSFRPYHVPH